MGPPAPAAGKGERDPPSKDGDPIASAPFRRGGGEQVPGSAAAPSGFPRDARVSPFFTLAAAAAAAPPATRSTPAGFHFHRGRSRTPPPDGVRLVFLPAEHSSAPTSHAHSCPPAAGAVAAQATGETGVGGGYWIRRGMSKSYFKGCVLWGIPDVLLGTRVPTRPEYGQNNQIWYPGIYPSMTRTARFGTWVSTRVRPK